MLETTVGWDERTDEELVEGLASRVAGDLAVPAGGGHLELTVDVPADLAWPPLVEVRDRARDAVYRRDLQVEQRGRAVLVLWPGRYEVRVRRDPDDEPLGPWVPVDVREGDTTRVSLGLE